MDPKTPARREELLDEALEESFPASDPIALSASNRHVDEAEERAPRSRRALGRRPKVAQRKRRS